MRGWLCAVCLCASLTCHAETLSEIYAAAKAADPRLALAGADFDAEAARSRQARSQLLPRASAQATQTRTSLEYVDLNTPISYYDGRRYSIGLQQTVFDWSKVRNFQVSKSAMRQSDAERAHTRDLVRMDVIDLYLKGLSAAEKMTLAREEETTSTAQLEQVRALQARQLAKLTDLLVIEARSDALRAARIRAESEYRIALDALEQLSGQSIFGISGLAENAELPVLEGALQEWEQRSVDGNAELKVYRQAQETARLALSQRRAAALPVLTLQASTQESDIGYENSRNPNSRTGVVGLSVSLPLFAGGAIVASVQEGAALRRSALFQYEQAERQVRADTRAAYQQLQALLAAREAARRAVDSTQRSLQANERAFQLSAATISELLEARREAYAARRDFADAQYEYLRQWAVLMYQTGVLDDAAVTRLSALLTRQSPASFR